MRAVAVALVATVVAAVALETSTAEKSSEGRSPGRQLPLTPASALKLLAGLPHRLLQSVRPAGQLSFIRLCWAYMGRGGVSFYYGCPLLQSTNSTGLLHQVSSVIGPHESWVPVHQVSSVTGPHQSWVPVHQVSSVTGPHQSRVPAHYQPS